MLPPSGFSAASPIDRPPPPMSTHARRPSDGAAPRAVGSAPALRVVKKLAPGQPGTKKLLERHGSALLCVRYQHDAPRLYRYTTIELVVDSRPIHPARFDAASFGLHLEREEHQLRRTVKLAGARWDPVDRLWWMRGKTIRQLGLEDRIRGV